MGRYQGYSPKARQKIDLRRVPEWERECERIRDHFKQFDIERLKKAFDCLRLACFKAGSIGGLFTRVYSSDMDRACDYWLKRDLTADDLIDFALRIPDGLRCFLQGDPMAVMRAEHAELEKEIAEASSKGVTGSRLISKFTSKTHADTLAELQNRRNAHRELIQTAAFVEAVTLLRELFEASELYRQKLSNLESKLRKAGEKQAAIERFEKIHGNAYAQADAARNATRVRAEGLKGLVKPTKECPYCGMPLGADKHLDHIYPVSKGGLSAVYNLVWCCAACNAIKSDKGLFQFLEERGVSVDAAVKRLKALGKHV